MAALIINVNEIILMMMAIPISLCLGFVFVHLKANLISIFHKINFCVWLGMIQIFKRKEQWKMIQIYVFITVVILGFAIEFIFNSVHLVIRLVKECKKDNNKVSNLNTIGNRQKVDTKDVSRSDINSNMSFNRNELSQARNISSMRADFQNTPEKQAEGYVSKLKMLRKKNSTTTTENRFDEGRRSIVQIKSP
mmetsp:Transcript_7767/g.6866  ORF Transcript_7767/g.6866 Transcript_7767/m.6866 type:complete len:193 (+) Transcript_7767:214-792(+)